jgi:hypothetical protein
MAGPARLSRNPGFHSTTHARVGQVAQLSILFHDVSGTATIVDDCTIVLAEFNFDGEGIIVEIYGGTDGSYQPPVGFSISGDIKGTSFANDTLTLTLPEDISLDNFNGISVWCTAVGISFGDGLFAAP